jgi:crossover junction endodeoxyribonuclease RuvC
MTAFIGLDPGLSGAWGAIDHTGKYLGCGDMHHKDKIILTNMVWSEICQATHKMDREFVIEQVSSRPAQGVVSVFTFGMAYMAAISIAQRSMCPTTFVTPKVWKGHFGLSKDKNLSLELARELWTEAPLKRKKDNGRAEALLISEFFRREMYDK